MKVIIILFTLFLIFNVTASAQTLSYQYRPQNLKGFSLDLHELTQHFIDQNYNRLTSISTGNIPYIHADEVLTTEFNQGQIFIKMGLIAPVNFQYSITELKSKNHQFFVYHTNEASIAFFNIDRLQVTRLIEGLDSSKIVHQSFTHFLIADAAADEINCTSPAQNPYTDLEKISDKVENSVLLKKISECAITAFKSAKGSIEETSEFFKKMVNNPTALWEDVKQNYDALKSFTMNFNREIQNIFKTMTNLTMEDKLNIACSLTGEVGTVFILSLTGAGVAIGSAKLIASALPKLLRMKSLMVKFQRYKIPNKTAMETLSCGI
jgi:hypothetical protein